MIPINRTNAALVTVLLMCFAITCSSGIASAPVPRNSWNPKAAATYLDRRAEWWMSWPGAARDHDTFCISCHTALLYALSRSALGGVLGQKVLAPDECRVLDNVIKRVPLE